MKRILMLGPVPPPYGGIASLVDDMIHSDLRNEYAIEIFPRSEGYPAGMDGLLGRNLFRLKRFARFFGKCLFGDFDLIHIHSADIILWGTATFVLLARIAGKKVLLHIHGTDWNKFYESESAWRKFWKKTTLSLPAKIVVVYPLWEEKIRKLGIKTDVTFIRNLVIPPPLPDRSEVDETRARLHLTKDHFVVLMVGSVGERKGVFDLLKAVPKVVSQDDSVMFVLAGGEELPGEMDQILGIIEVEKIEPWVKVLGEVERDRIPRLLGLADLFILPSHAEGMPLAILEAMRSGVPIISTYVGGIPDTIQNEISGLLIHPGSAAEIAAAVLRLRKDDALRQRLVSRAEKEFEEKYEFSKGINEIRSLYRSL